MPRDTDERAESQLGDTDERAESQPGDTDGGAEPLGDTGERTRRPLVFSRIVVTWVELVVVGFAGAALGSATAGPVQLVVYLATTLVSVAVIVYNVDQLVRARLRERG